MKLNPFDLTDKSPWQIAIRGAAIPGAMVVACAIVGAVMGILGEGNLISLTKIGIGTGLFFSLWGGLEIMATIVFTSKTRRSGIYLALGYFVVWTICLCLIFL